MPSLHVLGFYLGSHLFSNISYVNIFEKNLLFANGNRYLKKKNCHQHGLNNIFQNSAIEPTVDLQSMNYGFKFYIYLILQILMNTIILKKVLTFINAVQACHLLQTLINYMYICPISLSNWPKGKQVTYEINTCTYGCRRIWA